MQRVAFTLALIIVRNLWIVATTVTIAAGRSTRAPVTQAA
jgi:hypothetical protein